MPTKKKTNTKKEESFVEKLEDKAKKIGEDLIEGVKEVEKEIEEGVKEVVSELTHKDSDEKITKKSTKDTNEKETSKKLKLEELKKKAEKLAQSVETKEIKKEKDDEEKYKDLLVPIEDYLKSSIHLGTRAITPDMKPFVYKRRADSLAVFNTILVDQKIKETIEYLSQFAPEDITIVCKREAGHHAVELFGKITGIKTFTKKYPAGILTNPNLEDFIETDLLFICDPWTDKNALKDASIVKVPVLAICDTNNYTQGVTKILPGNNKSSKSLGFVFYILAKHYAEKRKIDVEIPPISQWVENWDSLVPPK